VAVRVRAEQVGEVSAVRGLLDRDELLQLLDRAVTKRVTVISAPPGSGKTSLLRAWAERSANGRRIAFVSVECEQQNPERFWSPVLGAIRSPAGAVDHEPQTETTEPLGGDTLVETVRLEIAAQAHPVVLIVDDLHELRSAEALGQLEELLASLPGSARVVLSSRRDPPVGLHLLRLADDLAEIRAGDPRFTERETRDLLASSGISLSDTGAAALRERTEGWAAGLRLAVISLRGHPDPERFVAEFSGTDRAIGEYLMAEMLERQPSEVQSMLLRTSVLDRVNGELAELYQRARALSRCCWNSRTPMRSLFRLTLSGRGFVTTSYWRISCDWSSDERWATRFVSYTAALRSCLSPTVMSSKPCATCCRPATGPRRPDCSPITPSV